MFFSTDLLSVRGGKFGTIWLLATTRDRKAVFKKKKAELLRTNMAKLCHELIKMFPVQGKDKSFSLRTSSILMYGTCVNLRLISEDLRKAVLLLLSHRPTNAGGVSGGIDLPGGQMNPHLARLEVPTEVDFDMGNLQMMEVEDAFAQIDFRARESDITMREQNMTGLEFQGQELPILSIQDILAESWSLEVEDGGHAGGIEGDRDQGQSRTRTIPPSNLSSSPKRARLAEPQELSEMMVEEPLGDVVARPMEVTRMEQDDHVLDIGAPVRPRVPSDPTIEVTPAVDDEKKRKRTPTTLDMEAVAADDLLPPSPPPVPEAFPPSPLPVVDIQPPSPLPAMENIPPTEDSQLDLQPLVPVVAKKTKGRKGKQGLVWVDLETQISSDSIRQGLHNYEDTMRCQDVAMDLANRLPKPTVGFRAPGRDLGMALVGEFKEAIRQVGVDREFMWDWVVEEDEERERQNTMGERSVEASGQGSRLEERNASGSFLGLPQAESSRIVPDMEKTLVEGQLEDIREQEEEEDRVSTRVDVDKTVEDARMKIFESEQHGAGVHQDHQQVGDGRDLLPPVDTLLHTTLVQENDQNTPLEGMQRRVDNQEMIQDFQPPQQEDDLCQGMFGVDDHHLQRSPSPTPLSPGPSESQATVQSKLIELALGQGWCLFSDLCPPTTTTRREAAITFFHLLQMEKEKKVSNIQEDGSDTIKIELTRS